MAHTFRIKKLMRFNHVFGVFPRTLKKDTLMQSIKEKCVDALNYKFTSIYNSCYYLNKLSEITAIDDSEGLM